MFIHYDNTTNRVTGYTSFTAVIPDPWPEPTIELADNFVFEFELDEYEVQGTTIVHVGKSQAKIDAESLERQDILNKDVEKYLDEKAALRGYSSIFTAALRASLTNSPYHQEGVAYATWMENVWTYFIQYLTEFTAGTRAELTPAQLRAELEANIPLLLP